MTKQIIPNIFRPLFMPNRSEAEQARYTPQYKEQLRLKLMRGEQLSDEELGIKTIIMDGGRVSGKTWNDELASIPLFFDERGDQWYCRSEENTIRRSIFQSMQATLRSQGFTLSNREDTDFKVSSSPFEIKCNKTGNVMQFFAINGDITRTKGMFPPSGRLKKVMLEEANEPDKSEYVDALRSTAIRFLDEKGKIIYRYNPPPSKAHWANIYYPNKVAGGAFRIHPTWTDIATLLDPAQIADILQMKREDPLHYDYWYGGEVLSNEGLVIFAFDRRKHLISLAELQRKIVKNIFYQPSYMFYGVDSGITSDATAVCPWALYPDGRLIKLWTFWLDVKAECRRTGKKGIAHTDQVLWMIEEHKRFIKQMAEWGITIPDGTNEVWSFDGAALTQDLRLEFEKATHRHTTVITNKNIDADNARLNSGYRSNQLFILDIPQNAPSIRELESFSHDEEGKIIPNQSDHTIDADKYGTYTYYYEFL